MKSLRICQVSDGAAEYPPFGADTPSWETHRLSTALSDIGHDVQAIILPQAHGHYNYQIHHSDFPYWRNRYFNKLLFGLGVPRVLRRLDTESPFDVIHFHSPIPAAIGLMEGATKAKSVITWGDPAIGSARPENQVSDAIRIGRGLSNLTQVGSFLFQRVAVDSVDKIIVVSKAIKKALKAVHRLPDSKIEIIHPGVDTRLFKPAKDVENVRSRLGLPKNVPVVLCPARIAPLKAQVDLIEAIPILKKQIGSVKVVLVGHVTDSRYFQEIVMRSKELAVRDCIEFRGVVSAQDFPLYYASSDVVVLASSREGLPSSLLEAMSCGRPIVATDIPGNREAIGDTGGVQWVPVHRPDLLSEKISVAIRDSNLREAAMSEGREMVAKNYSWEGVAFKTTSVYMDLVRDSSMHR